MTQVDLPSAFSPPARDIDWYLNSIEALLDSAEWEVVQSSIRDVLAHFLELRIISHGEVAHVREMPNVYGARAAREVADFLQDSFDIVLPRNDLRALSRAILKAHEPDAISAAAYYELIKRALPT